MVANIWGHRAPRTDSSGMTTQVKLQISVNRSLSSRMRQLLQNINENLSLIAKYLNNRGRIAQLGIQKYQPGGGEIKNVQELEVEVATINWKLNHKDFYQDPDSLLRAINGLNKIFHVAKDKLSKTNG
ncbi:MAG: hypothetical protein ABIH50_06215 [bacterium]